MAHGLLPLLIFGLSRAVQLTMAAGLARKGGTLTERLTSWDADFFLRIARDGYAHGYTFDDAGNFVGNTLAFFPGYPWCVRALALFGLPYPIAGITVSMLAAAVATVLIHLLGSQLSGPRFGYVLSVLFCTQPMSVVFSMAYSEALFCALVLAMLLALRRRYWLVAGTFGALAGLTRATGVAAGLALAVHAGHSLWVRRHDPGAPRLRPVLASVLALVAVPGFWLWVGGRVGHADGWFVEQRRGWGTGFDWGAATVRFLASTFSSADGFVPVATALIIVGTGALVAAALADRRWWPTSLYGLLAYGTVVGSAGYFNSRPRLLVPVLSVLLPLAAALTRARTAVLVPLLTGLGLLGCWFGAYMVTIWPYTI